MPVRYKEEKERIAAKTREDALDAGIKYFIGDLCHRNHRISSNEPMSLRYAKSGDCVNCNCISSSNNRIKKASSGVDCKSRHAIEDIMLARELGISVEDL